MYARRHTHIYIYIKQLYAYVSNHIKITCIYIFIHKSVSEIMYLLSSNFCVKIATQIMIWVAICIAIITIS